MLNRPWWVRETWRCCAPALLVAGALTTTASALGDITLDADRPAVQTSITIDGAGRTLSGKFMGTVLFRGFFIGSLPPPVTISTGATLGGTGTITDSVDVQPCATLAPGLSVGSLTTQNVYIASGSIFLVEIDASGSDRLVVTGTTTLGGATLTVSPLPGYVHLPGTVYTLIANVAPVIGTFAGLAQGATLQVEALTFTISY